ncbi:MAG: DEAD/DEAH box helicase [Solirubrobacteraceae bacterium]
MVLLGDPQQLPQVNQAQHPGGSGASVLGHLLAGAHTLARGQGVLLTETWRMHPDVCAFVSERSYDSRLRSRAQCAQRMLAAPTGAISGVGLRTLAVAHERRSQSSPEEADAIAGACRDLLAGATVTDAAATTRPLRPEDILVVAPYNMAVRCIRERVPAGVRVGTVDRFQGQQAPVVFYAMSCSAAEDAPRGIDFLFDPHRLNVAISHAECLAILVYSARLLDADSPTLRAMEMLDGVCRFVETATPVSQSA